MLSLARGGPCVDSPITEAPRGPSPAQASGPSLGIPPCPRPGLGKIADFVNPKRGSYLGSCWPSYSRIPLRWKRGCVSVVPGRPPHSGAHPSSTGKQERVSQGASHTAPLSQLRAAGPRDSEQHVQDPCIAGGRPHAKGTWTDLEPMPSSLSRR